MLWRLITNHSEDIHDRNHALQWFLNHHLIALGWGHVGDLNGHIPNDKAYMTNLYWDTYHNGRNQSSAGVAMAGRIGGGFPPVCWKRMQVG